MLHMRREPTQAAALLLSWLIAPVVVIGMGVLADLWMVVGAIVTRCELVGRSVAPSRVRFGRSGGFALPETRRGAR